MSSGLCFQNFKTFAAKQSIVSNWIEMLADLDTPVSVYTKLQASSPDTFLFESVIGGEKIGRYSFVGYKALDILEIYNEDPYKILENKLNNFKASSQELPFFHQGYVGYFSFESIHYIEPSLTMQNSKYPQMYMMLAGSLIVFDNVSNKLFIIVNSLIDESKNQDEKYLKEIYDKSINEVKQIKSLIEQKTNLERLEIVEPVNNNQNFQSNTGGEEFQEIVLKAKQHIKEGDIFQVVLSHKLSQAAKLDPLKVYRILRTVNPSPYQFIYNIQLKDGQRLSLVGSSPEMLVKATHKTDDQGKRFLEAEIRPIAGTYKRGANEQEDAKLIEKLLKDEKEIAEHVMLVDLARNDLGRVCDNGSIKVAQSMIVEKYSHVMHIVSSVIGQVTKTNAITGLKLLKACFPAGTLSGAPKVEAIKIINQLEKAARGPYGGTIGYFGLDGMVDSAIMIRTLLIKPDCVEVQAGAGVVADSDPAKELQETYNKAGALMKVVAIAKD